jgi:peroxiredoxin Q/BCP
MTDTIQAGDQAPDFILSANGHQSVSLSALRGKTVVLYFYPKDDTTGCTNQAKSFSDAADQFSAAGAVVVGVSKDSVISHNKFKAKYDLNLTLASDPEGKVIEAYGCWVPKSMYGRNYMGIERSTFLIDELGTILKVWRKVKVPNHAKTVLEQIENEL